MSSHPIKIAFALSHRLTLTPQLQQSIKLLTLPLTELEREVRKELLENPVLEEIQDTADNPTTDNPIATNKHHHQKETMDHTHRIELQYSSFYTPKYPQHKSTSSASFNWENVTSTKQSLHEHLLWQIQMSHFSDQEVAHLNLLIDHLDDNGYLKHPLQEIARLTQASIEDLQHALHILQALDPSGVGAQNLQECLLIQVRQNQENTQHLVTLITQHLHHLENKDYSSIAQAMNLQEEEVMDLCKIIGAMEPQPGRSFTSQPTQYVVPDVYITKVGQHDYKVSLNEDNLPRLKIAQHYRSMLANKWSDRKIIAADPTQKYLRHKMNSALWIIRSLHQRQQTIFQVTSAIVRHQKEFFKKGRWGMKPLILKQIAEAVGLHESTISRITTNKYAHTPQGIYELKYFFNIGIPNEHGEQISGEVIKLKIQHYINNENKQHPISDQNLVELLQKDLKVHLARRTISRYREVMKIPSLTKRKNP